MDEWMKEILCSRSAARVYLFTICLMFSIPTAAQTWGQPVWSEDFSGPVGKPIDSTKWTYDTGILNVNKEVEYYYAPPTNRGGGNTTNPNAYLDGNGQLILQAIRLNPSTVPNRGSWTSARLITKDRESFQYGRAESRMSLPVGPGIWPAFWALGNNIDSVGWPACGETDRRVDSARRLSPLRCTPARRPVPTASAASLRFPPAT